MNEIVLNIISVVVTAIILPLISYAGARLIAWLNTKVKDENARVQLRFDRFYRLVSCGFVQYNHLHEILF